MMSPMISALVQPFASCSRLSMAVLAILSLHAHETWAESVRSEEKSGPSMGLILSGQVGAAIPSGFDGVLGGMSSTGPAVGVDGTYRFRKLITVGLATDLYFGPLNNSLAGPTPYSTSRALPYSYQDDRYWSIQPHVGLATGTDALAFFVDAGVGPLFSVRSWDAVISARTSAGLSIGVGSLILLPRLDVLVSISGQDSLPLASRTAAVLITPAFGVGYRL